MKSHLYKNVALQIREKITRQEWVNKLPTEAELCKQFDVSRITLRHAIQELCEDGIITKRQGLGMFIERDDYDIRQFSGSRLLPWANTFRTVQVLRNIRPYSYIAKILSLSPDDKMVEAHRICYYGEIPVSFITVWIPEKIYVDGFLEDVVGDGLIIPKFRHLNKTIKYTTVTVEPAILKEKHPLIQVERGEPVLHMRRVCFGEGDEPVFIIEHIVDGKYSRKLVQIRTIC